MNREEKDFTQVVIGWRLRDISKTTDLQCELTGTPLKERHSAYAQGIRDYKTQLRALVLEDARAVIANGLENQQLQRKSILKLKDVKKPRVQGNPWIFLFSGRIESRDDEHGYVQNVLFLSSKDTDQKLLVLASEDREKNEVRAKAIHVHHTFDEDYPITWNAVYLGSLLTHERMFNVCDRNELDCSLLLQKIVSGVGPKFVNQSSVLVPHLHNTLNAVQQATVTKFHCMHEDCFMMLQGPPGTGKTTTVNALLQDLYQADRRTMVCAPSNKAVQVLAERFLGTNPTAAIVFTGVETKLSPVLKPIFLSFAVNIILDCMKSVNNCLAEMCDQPHIEPNIEGAMTRFIKVHKQFVHMFETVLRRYICRLYGCTITAQGVSQLKESALSIKDLASNHGDSSTTKQCIIDHLQKLRTCLLFFRSPDIDTTDKNNIELMLLNASLVVFSTLSNCGSSLAMDMNDVYALIVDEAGQSIEAETLLAFQRNPRKVLLVGDTKQLPATVTSPLAEATHYDWSMMLRLSDKCSIDTEMLTTQYRMPLAICEHPSRQYYENRLKTAQSVLDRPDRAESFHQAYAIYNITSPESRKGSSFYNAAEVKHVLDIVKHIRSTDKVSSIGVITFYSAQQRELQTGAKQRKLLNGLQISTVDGFQGDECDIIIISCVRSNNKSNIGFVRDGRRLNVAITRAKYTLIVLANTSVMEKGSAETRALIMDAKKRNLVRSEGDLRTRLNIAEPAVAVTSGKKNNKGHADKSSLQNSAAQTATSATAISFDQSRPRNKRSKGTASTGAGTGVVELAVDIQRLSVSDSAVQPVASKGGRRSHQPGRSNSHSTIGVKQLSSTSVIAATVVRPTTASASVLSGGAKKAKSSYHHHRKKAAGTAVTASK